MEKHEALAILKLLSAMESWAMAQKERMPDYLHEDITACMGILEHIILEKKNDTRRAQKN